MKCNDRILYDNGGPLSRWKSTFYNYREHLASTPVSPPLFNFTYVKWPCIYLLTPFLHSIVWCKAFVFWATFIAYEKQWKKRSHSLHPSPSTWALSHCSCTQSPLPLLSPSSLPAGPSLCMIWVQPCLGIRLWKPIHPLSLPSPPPYLLSLLVYVSSHFWFPI